MNYHHEEYKFDAPDCFTKVTAKYSHIANNQPVFKDHRGNFGILRKNNWQRFNKMSLIAFMKEYFETESEFQSWLELTEAAGELNND